LYANGCLARFAIDEAHLVEEWGDHFRRDYQVLKSPLETVKAIVQQLKLN